MADELRGRGRIGAFVADLVEFFKRYHEETYGWDGAPIHDAVAVAHVIRPGLVETGTGTWRSSSSPSSAAGARSSISGGGPTARANADVGVDIDADGFFALLFERIARLG